MIRNFLTALTMLSCVPLRRFSASERELEHAADYFPLVGVLMALVVGGGVWCAARWLPPPVAAVWAAALPELLCRGFHLDGLADTADGFGSSRSREKILEIMHDSRIGTMGVLAIVLVLGMKYAVFVSLDPGMMAAAAGFGALISRCGCPCCIAMSRYARLSGMGAVLFRRKPWGGVVSGLLLAGIAGVLPAGPAGAAAALLPLLGSWGWAAFCRRMIGGATGDTVGAYEKLQEVSALLVFCIYLKNFT